MQVKKEKSELAKLPKTDIDRKYAEQLKKEFSKKGTMNGVKIKMRVVLNYDGIYHVVDKFRRSIASGTTESIAIDNAILANAKYIIRTRAMKHEIKNGSWDGR